MTWSTTSVCPTITLPMASRSRAMLSLACCRRTSKSLFIVSSLPGRCSRLEVLPDLLPVFLRHVAVVHAIDLARPGGSERARPPDVGRAVGHARRPPGRRALHPGGAADGAVRAAAHRPGVDLAGVSAVRAGPRVVMVTARARPVAAGVARA